jgi:putative membrane protein
MWNYGPGWGIMHGWGGYGYGPFGMIIWLLILAVIVAAVVWWFVRFASRPGAHPPDAGHRSPGLDVLEERYARGDINRDEYLQKKRDLTG